MEAGPDIGYYHGMGGGMVVSKKESSRPISSSLQLSQFGLSPPFDF